MFNLDAFTNFMTIALYNALTKVPKKLRQTPAGQQVLIDAAAQIGEKFIDNGYLGERLYLDDQTGEQVLSRGYEILTKAEDILLISDAERAARGAAPINMRIVRAGAIHTVDLTANVE